MPTFDIRGYHPSDLYMLYRICLETGADGSDATGTIDDEILGHFFAAPYAVLEPELCLVLNVDGVPCGYVLGTADSKRFAERGVAEWFPPLRRKYPLPLDEATDRQAMMIRAIHAGYQAPPWSDEYPAHLHIDILPEGQGHGQGPKLVHSFLDLLRAHRARGVHLGVSKGNRRALRFYPGLGFEPIFESERSITYGMKLT